MVIMTIEEHKKRHLELHAALDELLADWISATEGLPSKRTIFSLMEWSHAQTENPECPGHISTREEKT